jgi:8-oxo-dGTP pyrophosphatase MutT (NUDIX family)
MIRKNRPDWQAGKLNLPGGHIEDNELPSQAAARELFEETGLLAMHLLQVGTIYAGDNSIHVFHARGVTGRPEQKTDEAVELIPFHTIKRRSDLADQNIAIIHGLIMNGIYGWDIFHTELCYEIRVPYLHT